jgi:tagatose 1,6-diphosphate aldolase GatY/KbaY
MLTPTCELLRRAEAGGYAVGAFNVYNLEGVKAIVAAAEAERAPAIIQLLPGALAHGGRPLVALAQAAIDDSPASLALHLDHSSDKEEIAFAIGSGFSSVLADGSLLDFAANVELVRFAVEKAEAAGASVEAELGRLAGHEDGLSREEVEARSTDPEEARDFVEKTGVNILAVCVGNVHGHYAQEPRLDMARLRAIRDRVKVPLVLHGASGVPAHVVAEAIALGCRKFNVNTEVRGAFLDALRAGSATGLDLMPLMKGAVEAMQAVAAEKMRMFGSQGRG